MIQKYRDKAAKLGLDKRDPFEHDSETGLKRRLFQSDPGYAATIENLDTNIGKLVQTLEDEGLMEDTLLVFTSDNGGLATAEGSPTSNAPLSEGKGWMYEGGTREPFIAVCPGLIPENSTCHSITTTTDLYPTCLELAGIAPIPTQHCDGKSILPALKGSENFERGAIFWHYPHYSDQGGTPGCSARKGDWKLIEFFEDQRVELYNLSEDISENNDVSALYPEIRDAMHTELREWQESARAQFPQPNPHWPDGPK